MFYINQAVDIYNLISLESKLALGAHNIDRVDGNVTLRFTDGSERFVPIGQTEPVPVAPHEYCYCDDANEVLCRLEVRQVEKTKVEESARNIFYIIQGNEATPDELLHETAQKIIDLTTKYCGGTGIITGGIHGGAARRPSRTGQRGLACRVFRRAVRRTGDRTLTRRSAAAGAGRLPAAGRLRGSSL